MIEERRAMTERVKSVLIERLNLNLSKEALSNDTILFGVGLGLDSIDALQLVVGLEAELGLSIPENQPNVLRSINTIVDFILSQQQECHFAPSLAIDVHVNNADYNSIRNDMAWTIRPDIGVLKVSGEHVLDVLNQLVTSNLYYLGENNMLQTLMLTPEGAVDLYLEVLNLGGYYLLATDKVHLQKLKNHLSAESPVLHLEDLSAELTLVQLDGPRAREGIEMFFGVEVMGLRPKMIAPLVREGRNITVVNLGLTGESGYQIYLNVQDQNALIKQAEACFCRAIHRCNPAIHELLKMEACSFDERACLPNHENPFAAGLHWMIDLQKEKFVGKAALLAIQEQGLSKKLVPFIASVEAQGLEVNAALFNADKKIGYIGAVLHSDQLGHDIGYAYVESVYAWPGITASTSADCGNQAGITLVSAPLITTKSQRLSHQGG